MSEPKNVCKKCGREFGSVPGLKRHNTRSHPYIEVPPPKKTTTVAVGDLPEVLNLIGGAKLDVGDVFWNVRKYVIKKITKTAGNSDATVEAECTKLTWSKHAPL